MIPRETVDQILDSAQIADVVADYVTLRQRGANLVACCPFHNEKTPSFYVSPAKGIYKCFGCGKSGTAVGFVMEEEHCSYTEALRYLARKYHIDVVEKEESAEDLARKQRNESLLLVSEFAARFYSGQLSSGEGRDIGYNYFRSRGIEDETMERFSLGWAPSGKTSFVDAATAQGYKLEYIIAAGLAVQREDGSVVDKFRERVMFPVHSVSGRVVAFSGRTLHADNPAKYVNSAETEIYVKSRNLLGIYFAKSEMARLGKCILVEGNVDMVMMHQLGIRNVVASCGTSLTVEQIRLIHKFTENVTIMYDGDSAGIHAALRGINLVLAEGLNVKVVLLPDGDDPDSFSRKHTLDEVQDFIESQEKDFIAFKTDLLLDEAAGDPLKKANLINDIADTVAQIPDPVKRSVYVEATSARFGIESSILFERVAQTRRKIQQDEARTREREASRVNGGQTPAEEDTASSVPAPQEAGTGDKAGALCFESPLLAKAEEDLLEFLLRNGRDVLDFASDSEYYAGENAGKQTVAEFIGDAVGSLENSVYASVFEAYMKLYAEGLPQDQILRRLQNSEDRTLSSIAIDLSVSRHLLTIARFRNSLTTTSSWLVTQVPKAILVYNDRRIQCRLDALRRDIKAAFDAGDEGELTKLLSSMKKLQGVQQKIRQKTGREKTIQ